MFYARLAQKASPLAMKDEKNKLKTGSGLRNKVGRRMNHRTEKAEVYEQRGRTNKQRRECGVCNRRSGMRGREGMHA